MLKMEALDLGEAWRGLRVLTVAFWVSKPFAPGLLTSYWSVQVVNRMHLKR